MELKFKKVGWFSEELSARYEAKLTDNLTVRIAKCPYINGFRLQLVTNNGWGLDTETGDLMASLYNDMTKKEIIFHIEELTKIDGWLDEMDQSAMIINNRMETFLNR